MMKLGSLFDGSGGFPLGGIIAGITPVWSSDVCSSDLMMPLMCLDLRNGSQQDLFGGTDTQWHGESSMPSTGESPKDENASTLSAILQDTAPEKYYLSPRACQGILRRCRARGKILPEPLKTALERQSES